VVSKSLARWRLRLIQATGVGGDRLTRRHRRDNAERHRWVSHVPERSFRRLVRCRLHLIDPGRHQADYWAVLVKRGSVEDTPSGKVRTLVMPEDSIVKKRLVIFIHLRNGGST
jgi:hypothetical protein